MSTEMVLSGRGPIGITASSEGLRLSSPYDPAFVAAFKLAVPANARRWDGRRRQWLVDPKYGPALVREIRTFFGVEIALPKNTAPAAPVTITELVQLAYLGACKDRDDGSVSASGYTLGNHNPKAPDLIMPEAVLKAWFDGIGMADGLTSRKKPAPPASLYTVLCVPQDIDVPGLKAAYRRMARQTHPDVNKEPDAAEQFRRVQGAYDVLSDATARRKYDAGLVLEQRAKTGRAPEHPFIPMATFDCFRAPLRCGLLLITGTRRLGRIETTMIHSWQDLVRSDGRVLVSSWPQGAETWEERWVQP